MPKNYGSWNDMPNVFEPPSGASSNMGQPEPQASGQNDPRETPLSQEEQALQERVAEEAQVTLREQAVAPQPSVDGADRIAQDMPAMEGQPAVSALEQGAGQPAAQAASVMSQGAAAQQQAQPIPPQAGGIAAQLTEQPARAQAQGAAPAAQPAPAYASGPNGYNAPAYQQAAPYHTAPQAAYQAPAQKKSHGWIVAIVVVACLFLLTAFGMKSCSDAIVATAGSSGASGGVTAGDTIAVIDIDGTIQYDGSACSPEGFKQLLDEASDDANIKAVVLRVNSGGGTATAGEEMASYLRDFEKPVVVSSASINASAAYEISSQADYIYVAKSTEIGAIGTAMEVTDMSGLLDMLGVNMDTITSADSKDSSYGYRPLTDEERAYYQHMVDQINDTFVENVATGRSLSIEEVRTLATGLPFTGVDAVENGLADEVGTLEDAADKAAEFAGITDYDTYKLGFTSYDLAGLYDLLGSTQGGDQRSLPLMRW